MASLRHERLIEVDPDTVWDALRDWAGLADRLASGFVQNVTLDGADRIVTFDNGMVVRERLVAENDADRRLVWTVVDGPFAHYNGAAQVHADDAQTRFEWRSDLLPDDLAGDVEAMMVRGIDAIKHTLEANRRF
jgi:carbon monoxide dehydrogenase subunit G